MRALLALLAATGLGLAVPSAPAHAQRGGVLPSDPQDFQCFVLLQERRAAFIASPTMDPTQKAEFVNNLTIISAFYAGRMSHYSSAEMVANFASANREVANATPQQRDAFANICANFYFQVMNVLVSTNQSTQQPPAPPSPGIGSTPQR